MKNPVYKLIKTYPSIASDWKEGMLVEFENGPKSQFYPIDPSLTRHSISQSEVTNHPEFWEKSSRPAYEIIAYYICTDPKIVFVKNSKGQFVSKTNSGRVLNPAKSTNAKIFSVRRERDDEIFKIDDEVKSDVQQGKITGFAILSWGGLVVRTDSIYSGAHPELSTISHVKQHLFVSEDGVKIYEGEAFWTVNYVTKKTGAVYCGSAPTKRFDLHPASNWKIFSTEEAALCWIKKNVKVYTRVEIIDAMCKASMNRNTLDQMKFEAELNLTEI